MRVVLSGLEAANKRIDKCLLTESQTLYLHDIGISDLYDLPRLSECYYLSDLFLHNNRISDISPLKGLTQLDRLYLSTNQIYNISSIKELTQLTTLFLSGNKISDITSLKELTRLTSLYLGYNQISDVSSIKELTQLRDLHLGINQISDISPIKELTQLTTLYLGYNQISDINALNELTQLEKLDLRYNNISDITSLLKLNSLKEVKLEGNKEIEVQYPKEVLKAGWEAIKQFSEQSKQRVLFKNVKILLLGNPNIGKSNLLEYLGTNKKPIVNDSTHGVEYRQLKLNDINFHFWDFGGQEYFHSTHQLFFSQNAVNILLWGKDVQRENTQEKCFGIDYWLRLIQQLNGDSEEIVYLTENKIDLNVPKYSVKQIPDRILNQFPKLNFYYANISLTDLKKLGGFKETLIDLSEIIISKFEYPKFYEVFWNKIQNSTKDYVTIDEINNLSPKENPIPAMKVFHNMGMLLYFPDIIDDKVFVKPQVLLELLYQKVFYDKNKYKITFEDIKEAVRNNLLKLSTKDVIKLLEHFNLVFQTNEEKGCYFIPQYLPEQSVNQKEFERLGFNICNIKLKADHYLVSLAMLKLFTFYGKYVDKEKGEYKFWKDGLIITKNNLDVLVRYDIDNQHINLYASNCSDNKKLQKEIVDFILDLPEDFSKSKRNFQNHINKRWYEISDEKNYVRDYVWNSDFFTVFISIDNEYFIEWNELSDNKNLSEFNFVNEKGEKKLFKLKDYHFYININLENKNNNEFDYISQIARDFRTMSETASKTFANTEEIKSTLTNRLDDFLCLKENINLNREEIINAVKHISEEQRRDAYNEIVLLLSKAFEVHENFLKEQLDDRYDTLKESFDKLNSSSEIVSTKLELAIPLLNLVGVNLKTTIDIKKWIKRFDLCQ